ncbi:hypothetical protein J4558_24260 [Leptolyngbya sp. 15MV]|nr:hypothetical protein J4558_24260 [Leptolyngbya sp. 15MV]
MAYDQERDGMERSERSDVVNAGFATRERALPDRLPWPLASLVIAGVALVLWAAVFAVARALGF